ncbi:MAG: tyrosine-protein phosphatase [Firmicutes bacterium]|nr:tyrosine-protein phosphatase [Bacillota bacterium]MBQ9605200.1 tyrosine-protein phosphatase [Bacillota bacterium]
MSNSNLNSQKSPASQHFASIRAAEYYENRKISLNGVANARQLGGYTTADGKKIKNNLLLRTGALFGAPPETLDELSLKYKLCDIIDFRMEQEKAAMPEPDVKGARYHHISVLSGIPITKEDFEVYKQLLTVEDMPLRYKKMYDANIDISPAKVYSALAFNDDGIAGYKRFFDILLNKPEGKAVLFHCTQGKDRTGMAAILLLSALGADRDTVAADYLMTNEACKPLLDKIRSDLEKAKMPKEVLDFAMFIESVDMSFIEPIFDVMDKEFGSVSGYLEKMLKLTAADIERLKELYLEN